MIKFIRIIAFAAAVALFIYALNIEFFILEGDCAGHVGVLPEHCIPTNGGN